MSIWPWIAGGATAYLLLKPKTTVPAAGASYTPSAGQAGVAATATALQPLTSELYAQVPAACKQTFASAYFEAATDGTPDIWLTGVLDNRKAYADASHARTSFANIIAEACGGNAMRGWGDSCGWGNSYGSSYGRSY